MLQVKTFSVGPLQSNCHLLFDAETRQAVIIDPGAEPHRIKAAIGELDLTPTALLNTHGHGDHIGGNDEIKATYGVPLMIHRDDAPMLTEPELNLSSFFGVPIISPPADRLLEDGEIIEFGAHEISVYHTPGHSPGGVSFHVDSILFSGDVLFQGSIGRSDLPGASHETLLAGIRDKLLILPDETRVHPGHGAATTIGDERRMNPFLQELNG